ncbi:ABC transporter permease [Desulfococcus sp.]|uniref:ABC transporter permease n=1 Tax=Desulfococcus sp. TaxID=2025834 RepID=UPI0035944F9F
MAFIKLAFSNLLRHKVRSLLTLVGIAASVTVLFSILSFNRGFERGLADEINRTGIHFMVVPAGCPHEVASLVLHGAVTPKFIEAGVVDKIRSTDGVALVSPMLITQVPNPARDRLDMVYGLEMSHVREIKAGWRIDGRIPEGGDGLLMGAEVAAHDGVAVGERVRYGNRDFTVSGIIGKTGSQDDAFVYMPVAALQDILEKHGGLTAAGVKVSQPERLEEITGELAATVPGIQIVTMNEVMRSLAALANSAKVLSLSIAVIAVLISAVGVMNAILMAIFERTQEIGMMRAVGASRTDIFRIILKETLLLTAAGGVCGILLSTLGAGWIEGFVRGVMPYVPSGKMIHFDPILAGACILFTLIVGMAAGGYPSWKASTINPIEAIKG